MAGNDPNVQVVIQIDNTTVTTLRDPSTKLRFESSTNIQYSVSQITVLIKVKSLQMNHDSINEYKLMLCFD